MRRLSVIVPTYNEAENTPQLIERIENSLRNVNFELIIVDDNSPNGTADIAARLNNKYGNIHVLRRPRKMGLASAVLDALSIASGDVIAVMNANLQHPPQLLLEMLKEIRKHEIVIASRYISRGKIEE